MPKHIFKKVSKELGMPKKEVEKLYKESAKDADHKGYALTTHIFKKKLGKKACKKLGWKGSPQGYDDLKYVFISEDGCALKRKESSLIKGTNELPVGKHNDVPDDNFDKNELAMGIKVELEHTDNKDIAKAIAKDHLSELPNYYTLLKKMEKNGKDNKIFIGKKR